MEKLIKVNYMVYCNDGVECGGAKTLKGAKDILRYNKKADMEIGVNDIYYYILKEYTYKVAGKLLLKSKKVY